MLGSVAGRVHADVPAAMARMSSIARRYAPADGAIEALHASRYRAFTRLQAVAREIRG
jgi:D-ribulokinase